MKKLATGIALLLWFGSLSAQDQPLLILGEDVQGFSAPRSQSEAVQSFEADTEVRGHRINAHWYLVKGSGGREMYVWAWDVIETSLVDSDLELSPKRITPSAETLYRMMKYFKQREKTEKAVEFALRIINDHNDEEYPAEEEACFKLGHLAYMYLISSPDEGVVYDDFLFAFVQKVLEEAEVPAVRAMAYYHLARFQALHGAPDKALDNLLTIVEQYPEAVSLNECQPEDPNTAFYKPERTKRLFCALSMIQPASALAPVRDRLQAMSQEGRSEATQAMARELAENLGAMPYEREDSIWN